MTKKFPPPKKSKQKKIYVGQNCCWLDDGESGLCSCGVSFFPKEVKWEVYCPYKDSIYLCTREENDCAFQREITIQDAREYPNLFGVGEENDY